MSEFDFTRFLVAMIGFHLVAYAAFVICAAIEKWDWIAQWFDRRLGPMR